MWKPILDGALADRAWAAIDDVARALAPDSDDAGPASDSVLFWAYLASTRDDAASTDAAARAAQRFSETLGRGIDRPALHEGLSGVGFVAAHVASGADAALAVIDEKLLATTPDDFDVVSGIAGIGVYFLARDHAAGLAHVVDRLATTAARGPDGATWLSHPGLLDDADRWPWGKYDCGVAHGVAGVVGVLARIAAHPDAPPRAPALRDDGARWLAAQRRDGRLPEAVYGDQWARARTAWCYGEPGAVAALWGHVDVPDPRGWLARVDDGVADAGLCHGAAGLGHLANRLWHATGDVIYRDAARTWLSRALALPIDATSARAGNLLSGRAGVGLALLAAVGELEPAWDRMLVCDLPVR